MTAANKAIARELRSVARECKRRIPRPRQYGQAPGVALGLAIAAEICNRRASKLTAKAKTKGKRK